MKKLQKHFSTAFKVLAITASLGSLVLFPQQPSFADDTELFTQPPGAVQPPPNVMFLIDNSSNWNTDTFVDTGLSLGLSEWRAMRNVVNGLNKPVNVGLALFGPEGSGGAYVRMGARDMSIAANKTNFLKMADGVLASGNLNDKDSDESLNMSSKNLSAGMYEMYQYFSGFNNYYPIPGKTSNPEYKADYSGNTDLRTTTWSGFTSGWAYPSKTGGKYQSPLSAANPCARNYIIIIANNNKSAQVLGADGGQTIGSVTVGSKISLATSKASDNWFDEWAKYLYTQGVVVPTGGASDVNGKVVTYTIDVYQDASKKNEDYSLLLQSAARVSGGRYFKTDNFDLLVNQINEIFNEIQAVNSVFASVALPVSVNVRGTNLNQVYLGVFRPDRTAAPNWPGNVKQYKLGLDANENLIMVDKNNVAALSPSTGFFQAGAVSYWTSSNTYWSFEPESSSPSPSSDGPDGPLVERGGVNQVLRWDSATSTLKAASARKVYTYKGVPATTVTLGSSTLFDNANTALQDNSLFGASSATEREEIIDWIRGRDLKDENQDGTGAKSDLRPRAHGDVVHSRPAVINYNRYGDDNDVVVYYGANDGLLHAVQGGQANTNSAPRIAGGGEYWSFAAEEFFTSFKRMKDNSPKINWTGGAVSFGVNANMAASNTVGVITPASSLNSGYNVSGAGVAAGATVSSVSSGAALELNNAATASGSGVEVRFSPGSIPNGTLTSGSSTISFSGGLPAYVATGLTVAGTGIQAGSVITGLSFSSNVTLTSAATFTNAETATVSLKTVPSAWFASGSSRVYFPGIASGTTPGTAYGISTSLKVSGSGVAGGSAGSGISNASSPGDLLTLSAVPSSSGYYTGITTPLVETKVADAVNAADKMDACVAPGPCTLTLTIGNATDEANSNKFTVGTYLKIKSASNAQLMVNAAPGPVSNGKRSVQVVPCSSSSVCGAGVPTVTWKKNDPITPYSAAPGATFNAFLTNTNKAIITGFTAGSISNLTAGAALTIPSGPTGLSVSSTAVGGVPGITLDANTTANGYGVNLSYFFDAASAAFTAGSTTMNLSQADAGVVGSMASSAAGFANLAVSTVSAAVPASTSLAAAPANPQIILDKPVTSSGTQALSIYVPVIANTFVGQKFIQTSSDINGINTGWSATGSGIGASTTLTAKYGSATFFTMSAAATSGGVQLMTFSSAVAAGGPKPYFFDGPIGVYRHDAPNTGAGATAAQGDGKIVSGSCNVADSTDCDKVMIYVPMRRGGRMIYAFDVTDPTAPKLMWKVGNTVAGFEELGQTWSTPTPVDMKIGSVVKPVLIFGGGYDTAVEDTDPRGGTRTMGRAVYFIDAKTGTLIKVFKGSGTVSMGTSTGAMTSDQTTRAAELTCAVPSDIAVLTKDPVSGFVQPAFRMYFGDTCAQVWRIDTADTNPDNWVITRLANVGNKASTHGSAVPSPAGAYAHDRKFLFAPDVVYGGNDGHPFHYILMGSGDREHPFNGYGDAAHPDSQAVTNRFYMFKDFNILTNGKIYSHASGQQLPVVPHDISYDSDPGVGTTTVTVTGALPYTEEHLYDATADLIQLSSSSADQKKVATLATDAYYGWYITLEKGEKVVGGATTSAGSVFFGTNVPTPNTAACNNNLGEARLYQVNIKNGAAIPPTPLTAIDSTAARYQVVPGGGLPPTPVPVSVIINGKFKEGVIAGTSVVQPQDTVVGSRLRVYNRKVIDR
ncbi:PilC/PilY family type IV pilus protein [Acidovorax sp.]|uniref:PilC/PilY family type IV pilus protein n=1 Tax=Acidovorax sp. TaxID=1872122 RepID=UPI00258F8177|nr:PilC/PilY family type IV pilus protein [Acidovorax sp.]